MNKIIKVCLSALLSLVALLANVPAAVYAIPYVEPARVKVSLRDLGFTTDDTVVGIQASREYGFVFPDSWDVGDLNMFILNLSHSPTISPNSNIAIDFNGVRLDSIPLSPENNRNLQIKVFLPDEMFVPGYNKIELRFYLGVENFDCRDLDDRYVWATVHNTTYFDMRLVQHKFEPSFANYPQAFVDSSSIIENEINFIVPSGDKSSTLLSAVSTVSAKMGQIADWLPLSIDVMSYDEAVDDHISDAVIAIGRVDQLDFLGQMPFSVLEIQNQDKMETVLVDNDGTMLTGDAGILWMTQSPFNPNDLMLVVTGHTDNAVLAAATALANNNIYTTFVEDVYYILKSDDIASAITTGDKTVSLEEIGYENVVAWGTQEQVTHYVVPFTDMVLYEQDAVLNLHFSHSEIVDVTESYLTVLLNDTPIASFRLSSSVGSGGEWETVPLPAKLLRPGNNVLTVLTNMEIDTDDDRYDCLDPDADAAWLVVYKDSNIDYPPNNTPLPAILDYYPYKFMGGDNFEDMVFVTPGKIDDTIFDIVVSISELYGRFSHSDNFSITTAVDQESSIHNEFSVKVVLGTSENNAVIQLIDEQLPSPTTSTVDGPLHTDTATTRILSGSADLGYIQVAEIDNIVYLVVSGKTDKGFMYAGQALSTPSSTGKLEGTRVIVYKDTVVKDGNHVSTISLRSVYAENDHQDNSTPRLSRSSITVAVTVLGVVIVLVLAILIVLPHYRKSSIERRQAKEIEEEEAKEAALDEIANF